MYWLVVQRETNAYCGYCTVKVKNDNNNTRMTVARVLIQVLSNMVCVTSLRMDLSYVVPGSRFVRGKYLCCDQELSIILSGAHQQCQTVHILAP